LIKDVASGLPAPIKRNALKAFAQLCTAAVEIPVAYLEGKAAEKRAETAGRIKIIQASADEISKQLKVDPEFARIAANKYSQRILREQVNLDAICHAAALELQASDSTVGANNVKPEDSEISEDWINAFEREACQKSSEEMRMLFGKILAGEIRKPSSYSIRTIRILANLDNQAAKLFQKLCSMTVSLRVGPELLDARVFSLGSNAASNALQKYGLSFGALSVLQEYGLIISDYNSYFEYFMCKVEETEHGKQVVLPFGYLNNFYGFQPMNENAQKHKIRLHGVALSKAGKELLDIVDKIKVPEYSHDLTSWFKDQGLGIVRVNVK
jgi:hypothetical protein